MSVQFIIDNDGRRTAAIIPINEYEDFLHKRHQSLELTEEYKAMVDVMLEQEAKQTGQYIKFGRYNEDL